MADTIPSANMSMPVPVVGVDPGPQYASDLNSCLTIIDAHDHSAGSGVPITPNGLNINSDLPFGSNNATSLRSTRFTAQLSPLALAADLGCLYVSGVDLYYNDENGNQIRITATGAVAGTPGSISGLSAPASASYNSGTGTFIFQSGANIPGNLDGASLIIREQALGANGITLSSPSALAGNYNIQLPPTLPVSQKFVTLDASGNLRAPWAVDGSTLEIASGTTLQVKDLGIVTAKINDLAVTTAKINDLAVTTAKLSDQSVTQAKMAAMTTGTTVAAGGIAVSTTCTSFSTASTSFVAVTNLSVTITTTGRPVRLEVRSSGSSSSISKDASVGTTSAIFAFFRDASDIANYQTANGTAGIQLPSSVLNYTDVGINGTPGTYTYTLQAEMVGTGLLNVVQAQLLAYEI